MNYIINGGKPLSGTITPMPNKNSVLPLICAAALSDEDIILKNVPKSSSARTLLKIFKSVGGKVSYLKSGSVKLNGSTINSPVIPEELARLERSSLMFLAPLLSRLGSAELGGNGGCELGTRPVDTLIQGLTALGAKIDKNNIYHLTTKELRGNSNIWQLEASVTGTENLVIAATLAKGTTVIYNAASEPHVQELCLFLNSLGAKISGIGTNRLEVDGVESLSGGEWTIWPDHIDVGGMIVAALITGGKVTIKDAMPHNMEHILMFFKKLNAHVEIEGDDIIVPANQELMAKPNLKEDTDNIRAQPWPTGFPADLIPQVLVLATKAKGSIIIMNNMYETQLGFVDDLKSMKANVILTDPHRAITFGPSELKGVILSSPDVLQSAHALALAGFAAKGQTKILNADIIARRYPDFVEVMQSLGGDITEE